MTLRSRCSEHLSIDFPQMFVRFPADPLATLLETPKNNECRRLRQPFFNE